MDESVIGIAAAAVEEVDHRYGRRAAWIAVVVAILALFAIITLAVWLLAA